MIKKAIYLQYQNLLAQSKLFRYFWQFWSNYAFVFFVVAFLVILGQEIFFEYSRPVFVLSILSFLIARGIIVTIINLFYEKKRPYQKFEFEPITSKFFSFKTHIANSFPSRHTTAYFSVATIVIIFFPALGAILMAVSLMAGAARVILGYHWPIDIVVGALLGVLVGYFTFLIAYPVLFT
jgi:undecaprenyl-diphosphatase